MGRWALCASLVAILVTPSCGREAYRPLASGQVGPVVVSVASPDGGLDLGENDLRLTFKDTSGQPIEVEDPSLVFLRRERGNFKPSAQRGRVRHAGAGTYAVRSDLDTLGGWQGTVVWYQDGTPHQWTFTSTVD